MDKQDVVRELTRRGMIITPDMLEKIKSGDIGVDYVAPTQESGGSGKVKLSVRIKRTEELREMTPHDFALYYNNRYGVLRGILLKKMDALSINKAVVGFSDVGVIGMVREMVVGGFLLEDATGEIVVMGGAGVKQDDVVGVRGVVKEGRLFQNEIIWPDIPTTNTMGVIPNLNLLLTNTLDEKLVGVIDDFGLVFVSAPTKTTIPEDIKSRVITDLPNPCSATINKGSRELHILIYKTEGSTTPQEALGMLRRRHLSPDKRKIFSTNDPFLIDPIPDILWLITDRRHVERYRGVNIVMCKENDVVRYDAGTGGVYFAHDEMPGTVSAEDVSVRAQNIKHVH